MRGAQWLSERQNDEGAWDERESTGNGFPNHFYLRYHMYAHYFPLMALGRFRKRLAETAPQLNGVAMKAISILGSTGSVGVTTLDVVGRFSDRFRVVAMAAGRNLDLLTEQVKRFHPELVSVATPELARELATRLGGATRDDRARTRRRDRGGDASARRSW